MAAVLDRLASHLRSRFLENADEAVRLSGSDVPGSIWREAASELEAALTSVRLEPLTLEMAADESGYTKGHLRRLLHEKTIPNSGTRSDPRILRHHLPRKPGHGVDAGRPTAASSPTQAARAVIKGGA